MIFVLKNGQLSCDEASCSEISGLSHSQYNCNSLQTHVTSGGLVDGIVEEFRRNNLDAEKEWDAQIQWEVQ